ncbi:MAG: hypothetical protein MZU97_00170 [Bacillus subtilis]|nr:hypothetical protein [Bacillus subtilis]
MRIGNGPPGYLDCFHGVVRTNVNYELGGAFGDVFELFGYTRFARFELSTTSEMPRINTNGT